MSARERANRLSPYLSTRRGKERGAWEKGWGLINKSSVVYRFFFFIYIYIIVFKPVSHYLFNSRTCFFSTWSPSRCGVFVVILTALLCAFVFVCVCVATLPGGGTDNLSKSLFSVINYTAALLVPYSKQSTTSVYLPLFLSAFTFCPLQFSLLLYF